MKKIIKHLLVMAALISPAESFGYLHAKLSASVSESCNGKGLVYVDKNDGEKIKGEESMECTVKVSNPSSYVPISGLSNPNVNFRAVAIPQEGYAFDHWDLSYPSGAKYIQNDNPLSLTVKAESGDEFNPTTYTLTAVFSEPTVINKMYMSAVGVGTFVSPFVTTIPKGYAAYTVEKYDEATNTLNINVKADEGEVLLPYTPVIIMAKEVGVKAGYIAESNGMVEQIAKPEQISENSAEYLHGVYKDNETIAVGSYVLQVNNGVLSFYKVTTENFAATKYRCYLTLPNSSEESRLRVAIVEKNTEEAGETEEATAVTEVEAESTTTEVYSLNGEKQNGLKAGINIVKQNGVTKKILK